jgi:hypothetical protein
MKNKETFPGKKAQLFIALSPIIVLTLTWLGVRLSISLFPDRISWIPAFTGYYDTNCSFNFHNGYFVDALYEQKEKYNISYSFSPDR